MAARLIELGGVKWFEGDVGDELVACARDTVEPVRARHGVDFEAWKWGDVHQVYWRHPLSTPERRGLDVGPVAVDGGSETLRNTGAGQPPFAASGGVEYRLVVDFIQPDRFLAVQNVGNSASPDSALRGPVGGLACRSLSRGI